MFHYVVPFIVSLIFADNMRKYAKTNNLPELETKYKYAFFISFLLLAVTAIISAPIVMKWLWNLFLIVIVTYPISQKELRSLRMFIAAFAPYVAIKIIYDLNQAFLPDFFDTWESYFKNAITITYIWLAAILFSQARQRKANEKERIKRQQEDELNRAIAIRKVELEGLVAERTMEITKQKNDLEQALTELRSTQAQLIHSEKMASLGELTAGIAHEIQNPLNFVNNFSEVSSELLDEMNEELEKGDVAEAKAISFDIKQNLEKITSHGKRADAIVKGMLQHSRTNTGQKEPTDINALADEYLRLSYHGLRAKDKSFNANFKTEFDENLPKIKIIPQDIGRVMLNLITNAFYAVNERVKKDLEDIAEKDNERLEGREPIKPLVIVTTKNLGDKIEISVKDNGSGIPEEIKNKIFQPFFTTKPTGQGTGLGLSLSYDIVKAHGGELTVDSTKVDGTTFTIRIPIKK